MASHSIHHRINRVNGENGERGEPIRVNKKKHEAFHLLFGHMNVFEIAEELNEKWIPSEFYLIVKKTTEETEECAWDDKWE